MELAGFANDFSSLEKIPCPSYVLLRDANLTIVAANGLFLKEIGCDENELKYLYGSKLSAIMEVEPYHSFLLSGLEQTAFQNKTLLPSCRQIFHTYLKRIKHNDSQELIFCISNDATEHYQSIQKWDVFRKSTNLALTTMGCGVFVWDTATDGFEVLHPHIVLDPVAGETSGEKLKQYLNSIAGTESSKIDSFWEQVQKEDVKLDCEFNCVDVTGEEKWYRLAASRQDKGSRNMIVGILEDITEKKKILLNYLREVQFYHLLLADKTAYGQINLTQDRVDMVGGLWNLYNELIHEETYTQIITEFINKVVHPEDRPGYLEIMDRENLFRSYSNGITCLGIEFRRIVEQNKMTWMQLTIRLFLEPYSGDLLSQIYIEDIDHIKKKSVQASDAPAANTSNGEKGSAENYFDDFVGTQGDMAYLVDPDNYDLLCGNEAFYNRIGKTRSECRGLKCYQVMHRRESPCPFCGKVNWTTDKFFMWRDFNGALEQELLIKNKLVEWGGRQALLALAVDISNDKCVVDSIDSTASESHIILSTVEHMNNCTDLEDALKRALDSIVFFLRADRADIWLMEKGQYYHFCIWPDDNDSQFVDEEDKRAIVSFLQSGKWHDAVLLERPEAAMVYSNEMYRMMRKKGFFNQRWKILRKGTEEYGAIMIANSRANLQNITFLDSIANFIVSEIDRGRLLNYVSYSKYHDHLTNLLNRASFEIFIQNFNPDRVSSAGVILANIDKLSVVNTARGEKAGNDYIKHFAGILRELFGPDSVYRMNGDEYLVVLLNIPRSELERQRQELLNRVSQQTNYSVSTGYCWDNVEKNVTEMISEALAAVKHEKKNRGIGKLAPNDLETGKVLKTLVQDLRYGHYMLYLQPKFDMNTWQAVGAEALIRMVDKQNNVISPNQFVPLLESSNLIRYIDLFVFKEVCRLLEKWKKQQDGTFKISLNFSPLTLREGDILPNIEHILERYDLDKKNIEIEITESTLAEDKGVIYQITRDLSSSGYSLSLDDFGVRYANLSMLADIRFQTLKLDKSLIKALENRESNQIILKNIIHLCEELKINVIAEGVETMEQAKILRTSGCTYGQGYLFGKPMPVELFENRYLLYPKNK